MQRRLDSRLSALESRGNLQALPCPWRIHRAITALGFTVPAPESHEAANVWLRRVPTPALEALMKVRP